MQASIVSPPKPWWRKLSGWWLRQWDAIRPGPEARRGAGWGTLALAVCGVVIAGLYLKTGFGHPFDFAFAVVAAALIVGAAILAVGLVLTIARKLPRLATGFMIGCCLAFFEVWRSPQYGWPIAIASGLITGFLGATVATFLHGGF